MCTAQIPLPAMPIQHGTATPYHADKPHFHGAPEAMTPSWRPPRVLQPHRLSYEKDDLSMGGRNFPS